MLRDLRHAARLLIRDRGFTFAAVAALALGIAASGAVFTLFNGIFLRQLPFDAPDRIVVLNARTAENPNTNFPISYLELRDWQAGVRTFEGLAGFTDGTMSVADEDRPPERLSGAYVSARTFALIGQRPLLGRAFRDNDERSGAEAVVMLGHAAWQTRFGADALVVGRRIRLNGVAATVIGVMPEGFGFPNDAGIWAPLSMMSEPARTRREERTLLVLGRLSPGVTLEQALADVSAVAAALPAATSGPANPRFIPKLRTFRNFFLGTDMETGFLLLLIAVGAVLLIACANVANLLLARGAHRAREITVRLSIGASRARIVRQLLLESLLLAVVATAVGLVLAVGGVRLFERAIVGTQAPYWLDFSLDTRVALFLAATCVATAILFGLMPALHTTRAGLVEVLSQGARGNSATPGRRWTGGLVVAQLALSLTLLMSAGLVIRELMVLRTMHVGVETAGVAVLNLDLPQQQYREPAQRLAFYRQLNERLAAVPGMRVTYAGTPPHGGASQALLGLPGEPAERFLSRRISHVMLGPEYFRVMETPAVRGRTFTADDERVAIVNERLAELYFKDADPIGRQVRREAFGGAPPSEWLTIVGVAPNIRQRSTGVQEFDPVLYTPHSDDPWPVASILARSSLPPGAVAGRLREAIAAIDPDLPLFDVRSLEEAIAFDRWETRVFGAMFATFAGMALLLAAVGVYGVTAYSVSRRTREIGIRTALGARAPQIAWTVTRRASRQLAIGLALGTAGALGIGRVLQGLLSSVRGSDIPTLLAVIGVLAAVAALACVVPARRALRINPVAALRAE